MRLIKSLYSDDFGNVWEIEKQSLPKKKGSYNFYLAECKSLNKCFRSNLKRDIINQIKTIKIQTNGTQTKL